jgi:hypothetical protein
VLPVTSFTASCITYWSTMSASFSYPVHFFIFQNPCYFFLNPHFLLLLVSLIFSLYFVTAFPCHTLQCVTFVLKPTTISLNFLQAFILHAVLSIINVKYIALCSHYLNLKNTNSSLDSAVNTVTRLRAGHLRNCCSLLGWSKKFLFLKSLLSTGNWGC